MIDERYKRGKIYKVINLVTKDIYVGSTIQILCDRMMGHRVKCKAGDVSKLYATVVDNNWTNYKIILLENYPCDNVEQLKQQEQWWKDELNPAYNTISCYGIDIVKKKKNRKEYNLKTKEHIDDYNREYYSNNKEDICKRSKEYRLNNVIKVQEYHKSYGLNNVTKLQEYNKSYSQRRREIYNKRTFKFICECCNYRSKCSSNLTRHLKSKKHIKTSEVY